MTDKAVSASSLRMRVQTGYDKLDNALRGGFLAGSAVILCSPACDEVPRLIRNFLSDSEDSLMICRNLSSAEAVSQVETGNLKFLVCSERPVTPSKNVLPGRSIDNLTELNLQIADTLRSVQPKRIVLEILSDVLLRHKALQTRRWVSDSLDKLRSRGITTLAILNPYMHANAEVQAVVDLFDGNLEIIERDFGGQLRKVLQIKWMHGIEVAENEFPLLELIPETPVAPQIVTYAVPLSEPRWLTPLVNRKEELSKLIRAFNDALSKKPSIVGLQGEAGVGKTRLTRELSIQAQRQGATVLNGRATRERLPYEPWVELLREYVAQASGDVLRKMLGVHLPEFARLIPDIAAKVDKIPPSTPLGGPEDKIRMFEAVTQFLISISKGTPLLLLLDDLQWVDQASLDLLEYFTRSSGKHPILTVCCYKTEDVDPNSPLFGVLMKLNKERLLENIAVRNLNKEDVSDFIAKIFGRPDVASGLGDLIYHRTLGNPFFVEEVLRSLVEDGTIFRTEKGWDRKPIQELAVPESVKTTLRTRLTKLGQEVVSVLTMAAVIGSEFDFDVLGEVYRPVARREAAGYGPLRLRKVRLQMQNSETKPGEDLQSFTNNEDALLDRLEVALSAGLIQEVPRQKGIFRFVDDRIRDLLLDDLSRIRRAKYHLKIAEAMDKTYSNSLERNADAIAYHYSEGGDVEKGVKYSVMAGDRDSTIHAHEHAINDYKRALELMDVEGGRDEERAVILEKLATSYRLAGQFENSKQCYEQALAVFEKAGDSRACARTCVGLAKTIFAAKHIAGIHEAIPILKRGLKYLEKEEESFEAASISALLAEYHASIDEYNEANIWAERALSAGDKTKNFGAVAGAYAIKAAFLTDTGRIDEGLPVWERSLDVALQNGQYEEAIDALRELVNYTYPRDLVKARHLALQQFELCKRVNDIIGELRVYGWLAFLDWLASDWKAGMEKVHKALDISKRLGLGYLPALSAVVGDFLMCMGDLQQAESELQNGLQWLELQRDPKASHIVAIHLGWGKLRLQQDRVEEARAHFEKCVNAFKKMEFSTLPLQHIETLHYLTSIYLKSGEFEKARDASLWAMRLAKQIRSDAGVAMALQAEANCLHRLGDWQAAEKSYMGSLDLWKRVGQSYYLAKALIDYSEALAEISPKESRRRREEAAEIFEKLGARKDLERTLAKS